MPLHNLIKPEVAKSDEKSSSSGKKTNEHSQSGTTKWGNGNNFEIDSGEVGLVTNASGSARIRIGPTELVCAIYGPKASQKLSLVESMGHLECEIKFAPFVEKPGSEMKDEGDSSIEKHISGVVVESLRSSLMLEKYPKMAISMFINVISSSGNTNFDSSTAITCGSLALADASIAMYDLVTASTVKVGQEENAGCVTVATMQGRALITNMLFNGRNSGTELADAVKQCCERNATIRTSGKALLETVER